MRIISIVTPNRFWISRQWTCIIILTFLTLFLFSSVNENANIYKHFWTICIIIRSTFLACSGQFVYTSHWSSQDCFFCMHALPVSARSACPVSSASHVHHVILSPSCTKPDSTVCTWEIFPNNIFILLRPRHCLKCYNYNYDINIKILNARGMHQEVKSITSQFTQFLIETETNNETTRIR